MFKNNLQFTLTKTFLLPNIFQTVSTLLWHHLVVQGWVNVLTCGSKTAQKYDREATAGVFGDSPQGETTVLMICRKNKRFHISCKVQLWYLFLYRNDN